jgi:hypothetical protein
MSATKRVGRTPKERKRYRRYEGEEPMPQYEWFGLLVKQSAPPPLTSHNCYSPYAPLVQVKMTRGRSAPGANSPLRAKMEGWSVRGR